MEAPERIETDNLVLRRPRETDAENVFARYAADPVVTKYLGWPMHRSPEDSLGFIRFSDAEWERCRCGAYLIESRGDGRLLGSTGISLQAPFKGETGYVLAKDSWGKGYGTEALIAMLALARKLGLRRISALVHPENAASIHLLEKCGFEREGLLRSYAIFPNLDPSDPADTLIYALIIE